MSQLQQKLNEAWEFIAAGHLDKSVPILIKLDADFPNTALVKFLIGAVYYRLGRADESLEYVSAAYSIEPAHAAYQKQLAEVLFYFKRYEEAAQLLQQVLKVAPDDGFGLTRMADIAAEAGVLPLAEQYYMRAIAADRSNILLELRGRMTAAKLRFVQPRPFLEVPAL